MILIATSDPDEARYDNPDAVPLQEAFDRAGVPARFEVWDDPGVDWAAADLVVLHATWDYITRLEQFMPWLHQVSAAVPVLNDPELILWNLDKVYVGQLEQRGVPVVPTVYLRELDGLVAALAAISSAEVVIKPAVSNGSDLTGRFTLDDPGLAELAGQIVDAGKQIMLQPYLESVTDHGEAALIYLDGTFSHAIRKGPILDAGGGLLGGEYTEVITVHDPSEAELAVAGQVLTEASVLVAEAAGRGAEAGRSHPPLYARVDLVTGADGAPLCLELEAFEPSLFFDQGPGSADRFVQAVKGRL